MANNSDYNVVINKLLALEDKLMEIKSIAKILNIWVKENDYELIPIINMLNNKMDAAAKLLADNFR